MAKSPFFGPQKSFDGFPGLSIFFTTEVHKKVLRPKAELGEAQFPPPQPVRAGEGVFFSRTAPCSVLKAAFLSKIGPQKSTKKSPFPTTGGDGGFFCVWAPDNWPEAVLSREIDHRSPKKSPPVLFCQLPQKSKKKSRLFATGLIKLSSKIEENPKLRFSSDDRGYRS